MDSLLYILLIPVCFLLSYLYLTWNYDYWKKKGVPSKEGTIPFGNIRDIFLTKKTMNQAYSEFYWEFPDEPLVGFYKIRQPMLLVRHPDLIQTVLVRDFSSFHDNDFHFSEEKDPILAVNPFSISGERWKTIRNISVHGMTSGKLKNMVPLVIITAKDMINYISEHEMTPLEAKYLVGNFTADVSASCGFGIQINSFKDPNVEFRKMSDRVLNGEFLANLALLTSFYAPKLGKILNLRIIQKPVSDFFIGHVTDLVKYRIREGINRNDYLQMLINDNLESEKKGKGTLYSYTDMAGHCMTFYLDGYNTSALVASFALHQLSMNQDIQKKVREEIFSIVENIDDIDYQKIQEMTYLDIMLQEVLRLHPPVPIMTRLCTRNTVLKHEGREYEIEKGTPVAIPVHALHTDPQYFPEPEKFIPERFSEGDKAQRNKFAYLPFGEGPRMCVGIRLGLLNVKMALVAILMNFEVFPNDPNKKIEEDPSNSFLYSAKGGLWVKFRKLRN